MFPWEHLVLGYVVFSLWSHLRYREPPDWAGALGAAFGSQLPDLIDKPLAWTWGVTETGYAIGHSIFFAPVVLLVTYAVARRLDRMRAGVAFGLAYLSHLVSDVFYPIAFGRPIEPRVILWPIASPPTSTIEGGFLTRTIFYVRRFVTEMTAGEITPFIVFQLLLVGGATLLWLYDGAPVVRDVYQRIT